MSWTFPCFLRSPQRLAARIAFFLFALAPTCLPAKELRLTPEQIKQFDIRLAEARPATKSIVATLPATIVPPVNSRIAVTAPFAGTVVQVRGLPGQAVHKGEPLVSLDEPRPFRGDRPTQAGRGGFAGGGSDRAPPARIIRQKSRVVRKARRGRGAGRQGQGPGAGKRAHAEDRQYSDQFRRQLRADRAQGRANRRNARRARRGPPGDGHGGGHRHERRTLAPGAASRAIGGEGPGRRPASICRMATSAKSYRSASLSIP